MKFCFAVLTLALSLAPVFAQDPDFSSFWGGPSEPKPAVETRTFRQIGFSVTRGNDSGWNSPGYGYTFRNLSFFDAASPTGGWYWGLGLSVAHAGGTVVIGDHQLVTLGWMGSPLTVEGQPVPFDLNLGVGPTLGTRIQGSTILGSLYTGVGFTVGLHFALFEDQDIGVSWEPVVPLTSWSGPPAPDMGYTDFVVVWTTKFRTSTSVRNLAWRDSGQPPVPLH